MELSVYNIKGEDTGRKIALNEAVFGIEPNQHAMYLDVKQFLANQRQGTHKSKQRSEVSGSTRKLGRQKGGGGARRGDINSPVLVGGGRVSGPVPRDYSFKLNRKLKQLARKSAFSAKAQANEIMLVDTFAMTAPKTKEMVNAMNNLKLAEKKCLIVLPEADKNVYLSVRNMPKMDVVTVSELSTYKILNCSVLVMLEGTVDAINKHFNA